MLLHSRLPARMHCAAVVGQQRFLRYVWSWLLVAMMQRIKNRASSAPDMAARPSIIWHLDSAV